LLSHTGRGGISTNIISIPFDFENNELSPLNKAVRGHGNQTSDNAFLRNLGSFNANAVFAFIVGGVVPLAAIAQLPVVGGYLGWLGVVHLLVACGIYFASANLASSAIQNFGKTTQLGVICAALVGLVIVLFLPILGMGGHGESDLGNMYSVLRTF
jgi:hypothetical protein